MNAISIKAIFLSAVMWGGVASARDITSDYTLSEDEDWQGEGNLVMSANTTIDLAGHKLTILWDAAPVNVATITSSAAGGELHVVVPQDKTVTNAKIALSGSLKLVKEGPGTFGTSLANQSFTGGVEILAGTANATGWGSDHGWGAVGGEIAVCTNAVFEMQGKPRYEDYTFVMKGGKIRNGTKPSGKLYQAADFKNVRLEADSTFDFSQAYSVMSYISGKHNPTTIDLQGHTLTTYFRVDSCYFSNVTATRGTIVLNGRTQFYGGDSGGYFDGKETTLDVYGYLVPQLDIHIGTYICRSTVDNCSSVKNDVYVYERFKPITDKFWGCVMKNGSTLDLSEWQGAWNLKSALTTTSKNVVTFEDGATITIDVGDREIELGECLVSWTLSSKPQDVEFKISGTKLLPGVELAVRDVGIYYGTDPTQPTAAKWTGAAKDGDYRNPQNWECWNARGEVLQDKIPEVGTTVVTISGDTDFSCSTNATPIWKSIMIDGSVNLTADCDWSGLGSVFVDGSIAANTTIDLAGHRLTTLWERDSSVDATVTSSVAGGELYVVVPSGKTASNTKIALSGSLKLVKEGPGTFGSSKTKQTFTDGVEILDGKVNAGGWGTDRLWGAAGGEITVCTNGVFEMQGMQHFYDYTFVMKGGKVTNGSACPNGNIAASTYDAIKKVRLEADSTFDFSKAYGVMSCIDNKSTYDPTEIDLQGHTLTTYFRVDSCYFSNVTVTRGTIVLNGRTEFYGGDSGGYFNGKETTLDVYGYLVPQADIHVGTYICRSTTDGSANHKNDVFVYERFKPITDKFWGCVMKDGSTLDLSESQGAWNLKSALTTTPKNVVTFDDGATITIDVGDREIERGVCLVSWTLSSKPQNVEFKISGTMLLPGVELVVRDGGIYYGADPTQPTAAKWTGKAKDGDYGNPQNWECRNALGEVLSGVIPDARVTAVTISGDTDFSCSTNATPIWNSIVISGAVNLTADCDWSGLGSVFGDGNMAANTTIDLAGHRLTTLWERDSSVDATVTSSAAGGKLHVVVPQDKTVTNAKIALSGSLKLVKEGPGTFGSSKTAQTFTGGVEICEGTVNAGGWGTDRLWGAAGGEITVCTNGVFEMQGMQHFYDYTFVMKGGKVTNGSACPSSSIKAWMYDAIKKVRLEADSTFDFSKAYGVMSCIDNKSKYDPTEIDLQDHTLTTYFRVGSCYFSNVTVTRGTIVLNGRTEFYKGDFNGKETTLDVYGWLVPQADIHVGTYICRSTTDDSANVKNDVFVYERFKPITDKFWGCVMKNGSTLDLTGWQGSDAWNLQSALTTTTKNFVTFEAGARITVDLGDRAVRSGDKIISWTDATRPPAGVKFCAKPGMNYGFVADTDGLRVVKGMAILFR